MELQKGGGKTARTRLGGVNPCRRWGRQEKKIKSRSSEGKRSVLRALADKKKNDRSQTRGEVQDQPPNEALKELVSLSGGKKKKREKAANLK